jgi:hypothetical protein
MKRWTDPFTNCELTVAGNSPVTVTPSSVEVSSASQAVTLEANTCLGNISCVQWYLTRNGQKTAIPPNPPPGEPGNLFKYRIPTPITCDKLGTYTVSVADAAWNAYEASAEVLAGGTFATVSLSGTTLHISPDDIGGGDWVYQWSYSADGTDFSPIPGAAGDSLPLTPQDFYGYYKVTAKRPGGTAILIALYDASPSVTLRATLNAALDVTYSTQATGAPWAYKWYFTPGDTGLEQPIAGATGSQYTVLSVGCAQKGTYRVQVNCDDGDARAYLWIQNASSPYAPQYCISFTTLQITPDNIGTGEWVYEWAVSDAVGGPYTTLAGETSPTLPLFVDRSGRTRYYKGTATRSGVDASVIVRHFPAYDRYDASSVTLEQTTSASLSVTFAGGVGAGPWAFKWYFKPLAGSEQVIPGATASQYTIPSVGCAQRGTYRVSAQDGCGQAFTQEVGRKADLGMADCP